MSWTSQETNKLVELCEAGIGNKAIAAELNKPVTEVYAKRSQMCITIDKVAEKKKADIVNPEFENALPKPGSQNYVKYISKEYFLKDLEKVLKKAVPDIVRFSLSPDGNEVTIFFTNGCKVANIECDSYLAIIKDVCKALD